MVFGKLPAHGDFVARGLDPAERDELDRWLSATILDAREGHGEAFDERFDQAPPWRFALRWGEDAAGNWAGGAIISSVDGAGRRFPLLAGVAGVSDGETGPLAEATEALLYRALVERWQVDAVADALDALEGGVAEAPRPGWWTLGGGDEGGAFAPAHVDGDRPVGLARQMLTMARA